jgi:hypothetical protein
MKGTLIRTFSVKNVRFGPFGTTKFLRNNFLAGWQVVTLIDLVGHITSTLDCQNEGEVGTSESFRQAGRE